MPESMIIEEHEMALKAEESFYVRYEDRENWKRREYHKSIKKNQEK